MKKFILCFIYCIVQMFLCWGNFVYSQDVTVSTQAADAGVVLASQTIDSIDAKIKSLNDSIASYQSQINDAQQQIDGLTAQEVGIKQNLTSLASQTPPIQSALDLLNANPNYGINWPQD